MNRHSLALIFAGAIATSLLAVASATVHAPAFAARLERAARAAVAEAHGAGIAVSFVDSHGWLTRHPALSGGAGLDEQIRVRAAAAVAALPGVGAVRWATGGRPKAEAVPAALHCQRAIEGILKTRTIRFAEASATIDPASEELLDEVAAALLPCAGSRVAITGHTDAQGNESANVALSLERARTVREALIRRGIARADLRSRGLGSAEPVAGLDPTDPANRRIEFSVLTPAQIVPTPVDTLGAY